MTEVFEVLVPVKIRAQDVAEAAMKAQRLEVLLDGEVIQTVSEVRIMEDAPDGLDGKTQGQQQ